MSGDQRSLTIAEDGQSVLEVKGSKFLGHAIPVDSQDMAEKNVEDMRERFEDATHHVFAFRARDEQNRSDILGEYYSDDGEPNGSAGKPIMNVLKRMDLENVLIVVIRYYGGTNLGYGGLVRSYTQVTRESIEDAGVVKRHPRTKLIIKTPYDDSGTIRSILNSEEMSFEAEYEDVVIFFVRPRASEVSSLVNRVRDATAERTTIMRR
ncbi:MAG: YigZ family protein [Halobacteriaceae archaeon]